MKKGDLVSNQSGELGTFVGLALDGGYEYAEVIWFTRENNNLKISGIQKDLITAVK